MTPSAGDVLEVLASQCANDDMRLVSCRKHPSQAHCWYAVLEDQHMGACATVIVRRHGVADPGVKTTYSVASVVDGATGPVWMYLYV